MHEFIWDNRKWAYTIVTKKCLINKTITLEINLLRIQSSFVD